MSLNKTELANVKRLCRDVIALIDAVEKQAAMQTAGFSAQMGTTYKWVLWPSRKTAELRRRSMDLTRALADLRRS